MPDKPPQPGGQGGSEKDGASSKGLQPGQATAIWTGAVSLLLGVAYLALTVALDSRGGSLQPPPPEAFQ